MTTMIQSEDPTLHVGLIEATVWADAVEEITDGVFPRDDDDKLAFWEAAGIIADDQVDELWGRAITVAQQSTRACELLSRKDEVVFSATVLVHDGWVVSCTSRGTVANVDGEESVDKLHPMMEVAIAPVHRAWQVIRRVLPPEDALRHEPRATNVDEAKQITVDLSSIPEGMRSTPETFAAHLYELPHLPPQVIDLSDPHATVFTYSLAADESGVHTSNKTWVLGKALYLIDADTASMWQVPDGDLGHTLVTSLLG